jgi:mRNA interferase MazF
VVVSDDVRNRMTDDLIVVPVFTRARLGPTRIALPAGSSGLDHDSVILCEEITTLDRDFLRRGPLGHRLEASTMAAVVRGIRRAVGETVPDP